MGERNLPIGTRVASATLQLLNPKGDYTYKNPHPFGLHSGRQVRITATYKALGGPLTTYPMFYGVIDAMNDGYTIDRKVDIELANPRCYVVVR